MPSFDIVSELDWQEVRNGVDQANREISNRFDFKGSDARIDQARDILLGKLTKRSIDISCLEEKPVEKAAAGKARQEVRLRHGIDTDLARKIVKLIKDAKLKVQVAIQGDQVRVSGKKRDDLQEVIAFMRKQKLGLPLQYTNFRD